MAEIQGKECIINIGAMPGKPEEGSTLLHFSVVLFFFYEKSGKVPFEHEIIFAFSSQKLANIPSDLLR